jgi:hypothetical protein
MSAPEKPRKSTRRMLLKGALGAGALGGAGYLLYDQWQRFGRAADRAIRDHRVDPPATAPRMVIARGGTPGDNARAAIDRLGGMEQFVTPEDVVLIKPNMGWDSIPAQGANTHPDVVAEVIRAVRNAKAKRVIVTDCPTAEARRAFERSGILRAARCESPSGSGPGVCSSPSSRPPRSSTFQSVSTIPSRGLPEA